jgi:hypothetical protein
LTIFQASHCHPYFHLYFWFCKDQKIIDTGISKDEVNVDIAEEETVSEGPMSIVDKTRNTCLFSS